MTRDPISGIPMLSEPGAYSDGSEDELLSIIERVADRSSRSDELVSHIHDWPTRYHLSRLRSNVVRPLQLAPGMRVLDVGAGCGAIARYLGETGADVVALEGAIDRARVAQQRCADLDNVSVVCGNVLDFEDEHGFDLVVVVGVLEYAAGAEGEARFLDALDRLVRPDGSIAIAIENQLGLKYLVGFSEDHLGELLAGVEGYPAPGVARTFSRKRLGALLDNQGFAAQRWLYPFPDYKLPTVVLADDAYDEPDATDFVDQLVRQPVQDLHRRRELLADDRAVHRVFLDAGLGRDVANSFLVVASRTREALGRAVPEGTVAWLYGSERMSMWMRDRSIVGRGHERAVIATGDRPRKRERGWLRQVVPSTLPFSRGRTLEQLAFEACGRKDLDALTAVLTSWRETLEAEVTGEDAVIAVNPFLVAESTAVLPPQFIDSNLDNFIAGEAGIAFIDAEWEAIGGVDLRMTLLRGLWWFAQRLVGSTSEHPWSAIVTPDQLTITLGQACGVDIGPADIALWRRAEAELQSLVQGRDIDVGVAGLEAMGSRSRADIEAATRLPFTRLRREVATLGNELADERRAITTTKKRLEEADQRSLDLRSRLAQAVDRARAAEGKLAETEAQLRAGEARLRAGEAELQAVEEANARLRAEIRERVHAFAAERETMATHARLEMTKAQSEWKTRDGAARAEIQELNSVRESLEKERDRLARSYSRLRNRRVVRFGLRLARLMEPVFRLRRRTVRKKPAADSSIPPEPKLVAKGPDPNPVPEPTVRGLVSDTMLAAMPELVPVTVIVPVFNAYEELVEALRSIVRNTVAPADLLLIDDASTDSRIAPLLAEYAQLANVRVLRNESNLGFTGTVNRGFEETTGDVVILNSDVRVTPRWLTRLQLVARRRPMAATVTAVSDNAGAFSVPSPGSNRLPATMTDDQLGRALANYASHRIPVGPTGNGFCMYVRRAVLDEVGRFDAGAFPRGYGEENDFGMRAVRAGWTHAIDGSTLVLHSYGASFGSEKEGLVAAGRRVVDERYPEYTRLVSEMIGSADFMDVRSAATRVFQKAAAGELTVRPRILYVLHEARGGTPATNRDLMEALSDRYDSFVLTCDSRVIRLRHVVDGDPIEVENWRLDTPISVLDESRRDYREILGSVIGELNVELVHIRHLIGHTFDVASVARSLGVPVVLSFHDFYYACPTVHLLDEKDTFCGGTCTPGQGACRIPTPWLDPLPHLKHDWIYTWRKRVRALMEDVDAFVTTTPSAHETYLNAYPELAGRRFAVIEHGRDMEVRAIPAGVTPDPAGPIKIVVPGNLAVHKGSDFIKELKECDAEDILEFHFLGDAPEELADLGVVHGAYQRHEFADRIAEIGPAFVGVLAVWGETYSHIITEAWAAGVPLLVTALGAQQERILQHGGGWVIDHTRPAAAYEAIVAAASDPSEYERRRELGMQSVGRSTSDMAQDYAVLYEDIWQSRRTFRQDAESKSVVRAGLFVVGDRNGYPGSVHVRTLRRWLHPDVQRRVVARVEDADRFLADPAAFGLDLAVVQRTALDSSRVDDFVKACSDHSIPLVFDIDDDLLAIPRESASYSAYRPFFESIRTLAESAALVTVSTDYLAGVMADHNENVVVLRNQLDEALWMHPLAEPRGHQAPFEFLYFGTDTHTADLEILRAVMTELAGTVRLNVIGGAPPDTDSSWYNRIPIPKGHTHYPAFVSWLVSMRAEFDGAVVPLAENEFSRSKSDLKFIEMAALGLPVLASAVSPYQETIVDGANGLLVENRPAAWREAILRLTGDAELRRRLRHEAYDYVAGERLLHHDIGWLELVSGLARSGANQPSSVWQSPELGRDGRSVQ